MAEDEAGTRNRDRSRSPRRGSPEPEKMANERERVGKWGAPPAVPAPQPAALASSAAATIPAPSTLPAHVAPAVYAASHALPGAAPTPAPVNDRKQREVYVGNLTQHVVTPTVLRDFFTSILTSLPGYDPSPGPPIANVQMGGQGRFAFVEMRDEVLAATMMRLDKVELCGRHVNVGRPSGYMQTHVPPLDTSSLRLPTPPAGVAAAPTPPAAPTAAGASDKKQRELYVGNLAIGQVTAAMLHELFRVPLSATPGFDPSRGAPVVNVTMSGEGKFAFVELRDPDLATLAIPLFTDMELCGRRLHIGRPKGYVAPTARLHAPPQQPYAQYPTQHQQPYGAYAQQPYGGTAAYAQQQPYGAAAQQQPYGAAAQQQPYGAAAQQQPYGAAAQQQPYGAAAQQQTYGAAAQQPYSAYPQHHAAAYAQHPAYAAHAAAPHAPAQTRQPAMPAPAPGAYPQPPRPVPQAPPAAVPRPNVPAPPNPATAALAAAAAATVTANARAAAAAIAAGARAAAAPPTAPAADPPTAYLQLDNLVKSEVLSTDASYNEIVGDIQAECVKCGPLLQLKVPRPGQSGAEPFVGRAYVHFGATEAAAAARALMHGRTFDGNTVQATFVSAEAFAAVPAANPAA